MIPLLGVLDYDYKNCFAFNCRGPREWSRCKVIFTDFEDKVKIIFCTLPRADTIALRGGE